MPGPFGILGVAAAKIRIEKPGPVLPWNFITCGRDKKLDPWLSGTKSLGGGFPSVLDQFLGTSRIVRHGHGIFDRVGQQVGKNLGDESKIGLKGDVLVDAYVRRDADGDALGV